MSLSRVSILLAGVALAATPALAADEAFVNPSGWYVGAGGGYTSADRFLTLNGIRTKAKFRPGFALMANAGYKWADFNGVRAELEISYRENSAKNMGGSARPWTGKQRDTSVMGNLIFDIENGTNWLPYLGGGVGLANLAWSDMRGAGATTVFRGTNSKFGWQGIAGVAVTVTPNLQIGVDYRYKGSGDHTYVGNPAPGGLINQYGARSHTAMLSFRYFLGATAKKEVTQTRAAAAPPPPPPPAPPARPAQPPVEQKFLVFFDFDRSNLRADSQRIVAEAVDYAKKNGKARINATGHADTSGTNEYNLALSERRAKAVQAELVRLGIPANQIVVLFKGESQPLVATGDGVKEPQNRRVEIVLE